VRIIIQVSWKYLALHDSFFSGSINTNLFIFIFVHMDVVVITCCVKMILGITAVWNLINILQVGNFCSIFFSFLC
jgi:hypothetical protein